ncbi:MAG: SGNH/GDSL hydrolase family protein [Muriicola sp.]|nr:SGNH/GDSL hydrolase family protein [Muriicola sp.]NNK36316.1 SGNH/GDSL hydrolase family protein [Eudoraea sp.]
MRVAFILLLALIIVHTTSYSQDSVYDSATSKEVRILFIGNSLTYSNNLPQLVKKEAQSKGIEVHYEMIAFPNYAIIDHWNDGNVQKLLSSQSFDFVILQQGPSSQREGRRMLIEDGKKYKELCELNKSKLCYFMVWPSLNYYRTFDDVIKNHRDAATINGALLLPVGEVWKEYIESTEKLDYYSQDGFHPSELGSSVAAKVIVDYLFSQ